MSGRAAVAEGGADGADDAGAVVIFARGRQRPHGAGRFQCAHDGRRGDDAGDVCPAPAPFACPEGDGLVDDATQAGHAPIERHEQDDGRAEQQATHDGSPDAFHGDSDSRTRTTAAERERARNRPLRAPKARAAKGRSSGPSNPDVVTAKERSVCD